jgi:hypothetical protein
VTTPAVESAAAELRAFLTGEMDAYRQLHDAQDTAGRRAYAAVLTIAFTKAAEKRFGEHPAIKEIIDFVADARVTTIGPDTVPPEDAERMIRAVLGEDDLIADMDARARGSAQTAMLYAIIRETGQSSAEVDGLLA